MRGAVPTRVPPTDGCCASRSVRLPAASVAGPVEPKALQFAADVVAAEC